MNPIVLIFILLIAIIAFVYMVKKNSCINKLVKSMKAQNYELVLVYTQKSLYRKMLGNFSCDLFMIRAFYLMNDEKKLKDKALEMLNTEYKANEQKLFLELYYHIFLNKKDMYMINEFLNHIVKVDDSSFVTYNQHAFNVIIEKQNDLIGTMEAEIEAKKYSGFALGTIVYLIALQYLYKEEYINAELYFDECLLCFHPNAFYIDLAKQHILELKKNNSKL